MNKKAVVTGVLFLTALSLIGGCAPKKQETIQRIIPVEVYVARQDSISSHVMLTGGIEAQNDAIVYSKLSEKLISLHVKPGDHVSAGQILAVQYNEAALQGKRVAEASLKSAQIQVQSRRDDFTRMENLLAKQAVTKQQFDLAKSQFDLAQATFEQAKAASEQASVQYENAILRAPFAGKVATVYFDTNEMVPGGQPVIKIVNAQTVKAKLKVPAVDINRVAVGKSVTARFPSIPDTQFTGIVYRIDEAVDPMTRTLEAEIRLSNNRMLLKSGLFGEFRIETAKHTETIIVSEMTVMTRTEIKTDERGVQTEHPDHYLYLVKDGKALKQSVRPGIISGGFVELAKGVSIGDSIIVAGQNIVKDGDSLRIVTKTER